MVLKYEDDVEEMKKLRAEGLTYREISEKIGCSQPTVNFYLRPSTRKKILEGARLRYSGNTPVHIRRKLQHKVTGFKAEGCRNTSNPKRYSYTIDDVQHKFSETPKCYLTGRDIDWTKTGDFHFDHIKPIARGGTGAFKNLGLACAEANQAKGDRTVKEHLDYCVEVLSHHGYLVEEPKT